MMIEHYQNKRLFSANFIKRKPELLLKERGFWKGKDDNESISRKVKFQ